MKKKIAILYGGPSKEHEVSVNSANNILENIDREEFEVVEFFLPKERNDFSELSDELKEKNIDVVFPVLHGTFGEDGTLQAILEGSNIPFIGSGSEASKNAMNKEIANELFAAEGISIPQTQVIFPDSDIEISFPIIVKPIDEGSSVGLFKFESQDEYEENKDSVFETYKIMMAQEYISGREFTCGVVELDGKAVALPVTEIILDSSSLFDYETKYTANACKEVTPAEIDDGLKNVLQRTALDCHSILGCKSLSRTDLIVDYNDDVYVLETNTLPGMTQTSFVPAQVAAYGLTMKDFISKLIELIR